MDIPQERDFPTGGTTAERMRFLLRYALLAPSSHNSQPWRFVLTAAGVDVHADPERWLSVADADRREQRLSIGCALENLAIAAAHFGQSLRMQLMPERDHDEVIARVALVDGAEHVPDERALFDALPRRRTNRRSFTQQDVPSALLERLCGVADEPGIVVHAITDATARHAVQDMVVAGTRREFSDPAFRDELGTWIARGVFGTPRVLAAAAGLAVRHIDLGRVMARRDAARVESAPALIAIASGADDPVTHVRAGRVLERVWLAATDAGLAVQPMSQPLQLPDMRTRLRDVLRLSEPWPQHVFRVGYAPPAESATPRRALEETLAGA